MQNLVQKQTGAKWSQTHKCWYVPCTKEHFSLLPKALSDKAILKTEELKKYLIEKKKTNAEPSSSNNKTIARGEKEEHAIKYANFQKTGILKKPVTTQHQLSKENAEALRQFSRHLVLKAYSQSTIRTYTNEFIQFLNTIREKPASEFTTARIKDYMQNCFDKLKLSENTLHSKINALKFYYEQVYPVGLKKISSCTIMFMSY